MRLKCPDCSKVLQVPPAAVGKVIACPCGKRIRVPQAAAGDPPRAPQPAAAAQRSAGGAAAGVSGRPAPPRPVSPVRQSPAAGASARTLPSRPQPSRPAVDADLFSELSEQDLQPMRQPGAPVPKPTANPYAAGTANLGSSRSAGADATLGQRFAGQFIDGIYFLVAILAVFFGFALIVWMAGVPNETFEEPDILTFVLIMLAFVVGILLTWIPQMIVISKRGQTFGKLCIGTVMVDHDSGRPVGIVQGAVRRLMLFQFLSLIPYVGGLINLADTLTVFKSDRRMLHDLTAGTRVVQK